jgi:hypothetical protein
MLTLSEAITNRRVQDLSTNPLTYDHDDDANHTNAAKRLSSTSFMLHELSLLSPIPPATRKARVMAVINAGARDRRLSFVQCFSQRIRRVRVK